MFTFYSYVYLNVTNYQEERIIYDVVATIYGSVEPGNVNFILLHIHLYIG